MPNPSKSRMSAPAAWVVKTFYKLTCTEPATDLAPESALDAHVRALLRELELTAQRVALSCAIANASEHGTVIERQLAIRYFPDRPTVFTAVLHGTRPVYLDRDSIASFSIFYEATALATEFSLNPSDSSPPQIGAQQASAQAWRAACRHAIETLHQAELLASNLGATYQFRDAPSLIATLDQVANGATTGVSPNGTITAPSLRDERRQVRYPKTLPATLQIDHATAPVMLRDISTGGCGFATTRHFVLGTHVTLILPDQSRFDGKIAWSLGLTAGMQFTTPITEAEAMFAGERRAR